MDESRQIQDVELLGSLEDPVFRMLALRNEERELEGKLAAVRAEIERSKRRDPQLMTIMGDIDRLQYKRDHPEEAAKLEDASKKKSEAKKKRTHTLEGAGGGYVPDEGQPIPKKAKGSRQRLTARIEKGATEVDKSLQEEARKS